MLTQKQEDFCLYIVSGLTQHDSWIKAGYSSNYPNNILDANASHLVKQNKIQARIAELRRPKVKATIANIEERQERLTTFIREDIESDKGVLLRHSNNQAIAELNKMDGSYAPVKTDHTFNGEGLSEVLMKLRGYQLKEGEDATK